MMPLGWNRAVTTQETSLSEKKSPLSSRLLGGLLWIIVE